MKTSSKLLLFFRWPLGVGGLGGPGPPDLVVLVARGAGQLSGGATISASGRPGPQGLP